MYKILSLVILIYGHFGNTQVAKDEVSMREKLGNCTCIPQFRCSYANIYMVGIRLNIIPEELKCTKGYVCCKIVSTPDGLNLSTNVPPTPKPRTMLNSIEDKNCGISKNIVDIKILNSDDESAATVRGEFPWMVEIFEKKYDYVFICSGTLIHPKVVLTATHPLEKAGSRSRSMRVVATREAVFQNMGVNPDNERSVHKIIKHPNYNDKLLHNDISLIILKKMYSFGDTGLNSICLPNPTEQFVGRRCYAVGWGQNKNHKSLLRKVDLPILTFEKCSQIAKSSPQKVDLHESFTCAGGEEGKDTCMGDGGGPLMCVGDEYEFVQVGIVSWGFRKTCGIEGEPGVYVNVSFYHDWINKSLKREGIIME